LPLFTKTIEPFKWYPESIIDSEEEAKKVIKENCYYYFVMGSFLLVLGTILFVFSGYPQHSGRIYIAISVVTVGIIFIILPLIIQITKSRIACISLIIFVFIYLVHILINIRVGQIGIGTSILFWTILVLALKRITVAVFTYHRPKLSDSSISHL
jgi:hypothetical protein